VGRTELNEEELKRHEVLSRVERKEVSLREAASLLRVSYAQAKRLRQRHRQGGAAALRHGNADRRSNRAKPETLREQVLELVRDEYGGGEPDGFGPTLAAEHLESDHGIRVGVTALRQWMLEAGLWQRRRRRKPRRQRRPRKEHFGELLQLDGSHHRWLEERGPQACLMNLVDDATGVAQCLFSEQETTWAAAELLERWVRFYGVPQALYTDWSTVYLRKATQRERLAGAEPATHFGRMCEKLGIELIGAGSPQAKGRVERANATHQC
jgi:transposase